MLLMMLERGEPVEHILFFDTGWEFPEILEHIELLEQRIERKIWRLHPRLPFEYELFHKPIIARKGDQKGEVHRIGNGWPSPMRRWCTRRKQNALDHFAKTIPDAVQCIGYAYDEQKRTQTKNASDGLPKRYPLIEWEVTEAQALEYCYSRGYDFGGVYEHFDRVSCFCCPLGGIRHARTLRKHYPHLWAKVLQWDALKLEHNRGFIGYKSAHDLERRFSIEDRQGELVAN